MIPGRLLKSLIRIYSIAVSGNRHQIEVNKFVSINSFSDSALESRGPLPELEILVPAAAKDLEISKLTVVSALQSSVNPISKVTLVVPRNDLTLFQEYFKGMNLDSLIILDEEEVVGSDLVLRIRSEYSNRAGWVLAEFIKYIFISESKKLGVLVIDADTIVTAERVWLTQDLKQNVFPVFEYHQHYFDFLNFLGVPMLDTTHSYMSHYMLFQPSVYRKMIQEFKSTNPLETLNLLVNFPSKNPHSPVCFCYEAYGHFAKSEYPERFIDAKWSNVQVPRNEFLRCQNRYLRVGKKHFSSISTHSYLK